MWQPQTPCRAASRSGYQKRVEWNWCQHEAQGHRRAFCGQRSLSKSCPGALSSLLNCYKDSTPHLQLHVVVFISRIYKNILASVQAGLQTSRCATHPWFLRGGQSNTLLSYHSVFKSGTHLTKEAAEWSPVKLATSAQEIPSPQTVLGLDPQTWRSL